MKPLLSGVLLVSLLCPGGANAYTLTLPLTLEHFLGHLDAGACSVHLLHGDSVIHLPQVHAGNQQTPGAQLVTPLSFRVQLDNCPPDTRKIVSVMFTGAQSPQDPRLLTAGSGKGAATGIGTGILNARHQLLPINTQLSVKRLPSDEPSVLQFYATEYATQTTVTAGNTNATAMLIASYW